MQRNELPTDQGGVQGIVYSEYQITLNLANDDDASIIVRDANNNTNNSRSSNGSRVWPCKCNVIGTLSDGDIAHLAPHGSQ